jgi:hypothetical protein
MATRATIKSLAYGAVHNYINNHKLATSQPIFPPFNLLLATSCKADVQDTDVGKLIKELAPFLAKPYCAQAS